MPDLIIMDLMMPGKNGIQAAKEIKATAELSHIPIIFLTARGRPQDESSAMDAGAARFISKPFSPRVVLEAIAGLIG
jgi:CheY-like chemotaxis protein